MFWGGGNFSCTHPKLYKWLISNLKAFFIGGAISFVVTASATVILHSGQVRYKNDKSVEQAINELYEKAVECGKIIEGCPSCTKLEYLESTGTQYINTNVIPKQEFKSIIDFETKSDIASDQQVLSLQAKNSKRLYALAMYAKNFYFGYGDWYYAGYEISSNTRYKIESFFKDGEQNHYINNQLVSQRSVSINNQWDSSLYLFARNLDLLSRTDSFAIVKIYSCQIYNNNTLVRDYIPVLDANGRPCLFDKVEKKCYYNQGTGEFLYG